MKRIHFLLGIHNHQPIGNFDFVFEKAYRMAYEPFLEVLERHPQIRWNLHASGILWEWLLGHHPEYVDRIRQQVEQGRLELLTGGFYEPILPALPDADKKGQIRKLTAFLKERFGFHPRGMWLAERVWEPHLPALLAQSGITYTLLDDNHFFASGLEEDQLLGYFMTEEQGATVKILPISKRLRYAIPFQEPGETLTILRKYATEGGECALVMADDGEKFGLWPETHAHVYADGWLDRFLTVLESNRDWIDCATFSEYVDRHPAQGRVFLQSTSYFEMGEWTLPASWQEAFRELLEHPPAPLGKERLQHFLRGGFWRNFLTKYEEANQLHKKMLYVSEKVHRAARKNRAKAARATCSQMLDALWAGQTNCAYWHGVFGGLYLPHLRQAVYQKLLEAERLADNFSGRRGSRIEMRDIDGDGQPEVLIESPTQNLYVSPFQGGTLSEWDLKEEGINWVNVLTRRVEGYHRDLIRVSSVPPAGESASGSVQTIHERVTVKEPGLERLIFQDWYRRVGLVDHFFHPQTTLDSFYRCAYGEQGDFVKGAYRPLLSPEKRPGVRLVRDGHVWVQDRFVPIRVEKTIATVGPMGWEVAYAVRNLSAQAETVWFGCELVFAFSRHDGREPQAYRHRRSWERRDSALGMGIRMHFDRLLDLWEFPLETVSQSENGFERTYQGTVVVPQFTLELAPGAALEFSMRVEAFRDKGSRG